MSRGVFEGDDAIYDLTRLGLKGDNGGCRDLENMGSWNTVLKEAKILALCNQS